LTTFLFQRTFAHSLMQPATKLARMPLPAEAGADAPSVRVYTVKEIAEMLKLSDDRVRDLFQREPGVLAIGRNRTAQRRSYVTLRIPQDVFERVYRRLQNP
jgi:hypothetical protein